MKQVENNNVAIFVFVRGKEREKKERYVAVKKAVKLKF